MERDLEQRLRELGTLEQFNRDMQRVKDDVRPVLTTLVAIGNKIHECGLQEEYVLYGGYGVLMHLVNALGTEAIPRWRGSSDIDLIGNERIVQALKGYFNVVSDRPSPNVKGKRTLRIKVDEAEKSIKLDMKFAEKPEEIATVELYGLSIKVPTLLSQFKMKLRLERQLVRDNQDVLNLLGVYYLNKGSSAELVGNLDMLERKNLYRILTEGFIREEVLIEPDKRYLSSLKSTLRRGL